MTTPEGKGYQVSVKGPGLTLDREVSEDVATAILQMVLTGRTVPPVVTQSSGQPPRQPEDVVELDTPDSNGQTGPTPKPAKNGATRRASKKPNFSATKGINFKPDGKEAWKEFAAAKNPTTLPEKALVAVYYMRETLERTVSTGDVIAAFDAVGWRNPSDPANNLQQAGSKGWLETGDSTNIRTVWAGEDYVKHDLPKPPKDPS